MNSIYRDLKTKKITPLISKTRRWQDIYAEAKNAHWEARKSWGKVKTLPELRAAITKMDDAVKLRKLLGDFPGLCNSLNVRGITKQRLAEWNIWYTHGLKCTTQMKEAEKDHIEASEKAEACGLARKQFAPLLALALTYLRSTSLKLEKITKILNEAKKNVSWYQRYDQWILKFLQVMLEIAQSQSATSFDEASKIGCCKFKKLGGEFSVAQDAIEKRIQNAALINWKLCEGILNPNRKATIKSTLPDYWNNKLRFLKERKSLPKQYGNLVWRIFDPLAP